MTAMILGHRGAPAELPENTMAGFRRALEAGADGVELDVRLSSDGVPVVIHDETVDRTTDGTGRVDELTWPQISALRVRPIAAAGPTGEDSQVRAPIGVPRLEEVVAWASATGAFLNVELKCANAEAAVLEVVRAAGTLGRVLFSSFIPSALAEVGRIEPAAHRFLLSEHWDAAAREAVRASGAEGLCLGDAAATSHTLAELAREGLPIVVWTVDDPKRIGTLLSAGVEAVITNNPALGVAARAGLGTRRAEPPEVARRLPPAPASRLEGDG